MTTPKEYFEHQKDNPTPLSVPALAMLKVVDVLKRPEYSKARKAVHKELKKAGGKE